MGGVKDGRQVIIHLIENVLVAGLGLLHLLQKPQHLDFLRFSQLHLLRSQCQLMVGVAPLERRNQAPPRLRREGLVNHLTVCVIIQ